MLNHHVALALRSRSNPQKLRTTTQTNAEKNGKTNDARANRVE
jgi:hypothetical protein